MLILLDYGTTKIVQTRQVVKVAVGFYLLLVAAPYLGPPLQVPRDFLIVSPVNGSSLLTYAHTHGNIVIHWSAITGSPNIPNFAYFCMILHDSA